MPYATAQQVQYFINTDVSSTDIGNMITIADAELDVMLDGSSMSTNAKAGCSARLVAIMLAQRDPESYNVGGSQMNYGARIKRWQDFVDDQVRKAKIDTTRG